MASTIEQATAYLAEVHQKIVDLKIVVTDWKFDSRGTEAGITIEGSIKLLIPKQTK